jgi:hypothetical protein
VPWQGLGSRVKDPQNLAVEPRTYGRNGVYVPVRFRNQLLEKVLNHLYCSPFDFCASFGYVRSIDSTAVF